MIQERNVAVAIILTIVTCGIYGLYWYICLVNDVNYITNEPEATSGGIVLLLTIVTCGIYGIYWVYKAGEKIDVLKQNRGLISSNTGVLYLILNLLGLNIVTYALLQNELNAYASPAQ